MTFLELQALRRAVKYESYNVYAGKLQRLHEKQSLCGKRCRSIWTLFNHAFDSIESPKHFCHIRSRQSLSAGGSVGIRAND